jgi:tRNA/tmRNA/rRNA uracil-C5-methylase (TrmA/RlmC/RlmD family)
VAILTQLTEGADRKLVIDATASNGGDTIGLASSFKQVVAVEINPEAFLCLVYNTQYILGLQNVTARNRNFSADYK